MSIFCSSKVLGFENDPVLGPTGSCGIPEFGTGFTRGMLIDTQPKNFDTLLRLSGFSHGTDVWLGNAKDLIIVRYRLGHRGHRLPRRHHALPHLHGYGPSCGASSSWRRCERASSIRARVGQTVS